MRFKGKVALITAAASGIGRATHADFVTGLTIDVTGGL
jgi:NAD(P)-dependent dehydrogenase (short-subunit alcohol dehydrogenase family)